MIKCNMKQIFKILNNNNYNNNKILKMKIIQ